MSLLSRRRMWWIVAGSIALAILAALGLQDIRRLADYLAKVSPSNARMGRFAAERSVELYRSDGLRLEADVYGLEPSRQLLPVILLLHGNTPRGNDLPLYRLLGTELAARGYLVLAPDFAGFGGSGDPFSVGTLEALDADRDVVATLDYVAALKQTDPDRIYLLGHSGGSVSALAVGIRDPRVRGMALIGPPRRVSERLADPRQSDYFYERARKTRLEVYGEDFPAWYTKQVWLEHALGSGACTSLIADMKRHLPYFSLPQHKPLLLIDGEREAAEDLRYLEAYYGAMTEPKAIVRLRNSDHYCNTGEWRGFVVYDSAVIRHAVAAVDDWIVSIERERRQ